jgi:hypothetical protein
MTKSAWILIAAILLSGCASSGSVRQTQEIGTKLGTYRVVKIETTSAVPETTQELAQLESALTTTLRNVNMFEKVFPQAVSPEAAADLQVKANIATLRRVGAGSRVLLGALAGRAGVTIDVTLTEVASGKVVGSFTAEGKSSGGTVFAGTTPQAIDQAVDQIIELIKTKI